MYSYMYMFMNGTTAIELSCIHISLASWHLFVPSSVYYASGTSLAKFPDDGIIVTQTLKDQGKTTAFLPRIWFTFVFLLYMYFIPYSWIHSYRLKTLHILIFSISHSKQSNIHLLYFSWATCTMYDTIRNLPQIMFFVVLLNWLWNQFFFCRTWSVEGIVRVEWECSYLGCLSNRGPAQRWASGSVWRLQLFGQQPHAER